MSFKRCRHISLAKFTDGFVLRHDGCFSPYSIPPAISSHVFVLQPYYQASDTIPAQLIH